MIDTEATVRAYLAARPAISAVASTRVYMDTALPAGYRIEDGPALLGGQRGGLQDFSSHIIRSSFQFRSYGQTAAKARELDRALFDALNDGRTKDIRYARMDVAGQLVREPQTGWNVVISFYTIQIATS